MKPLAALFAALVLFFACGRNTGSGIGRADPSILAEIQGIRGIDNHAHPVRPVFNGPPDREFDALPVDNMEPSSDPLIFRPNAPEVVAAEKQLYGSAVNKAAVIREKESAY
ncbi:MAG: hypothetical protein JO099_14830, partial [Acidobacteriia bacterium]|nr:hypothetical protein [Terriglobia bacterium]